MDKYYVSTAIDYANAAPHIGHAYEKIAADVVARYHRLTGKKVFFLTGTDEHGSKVEKAAAAAGLTPQQFVDEIAAKFQSAWKKLLISNDYFIRTTEERHKKVVQSVFRKMRANGDIYKGSYKGHYCEGCEDFLRERDLDPDGNCPNHKRPPKLYEEENYFFALSKYKDKLRAWLSGPEAVVKPEGRRKEVLNQLDDPELGDFSISRSRSSLTWGIPVPDEEEQVIYVWIDALTNYITGVGYESDEESWRTFWPCDLHLIGKDITKFHAIYWPAMLMSAGIELPKLVFGHGFITVEGQKMSKTLGNVMDPVYLADTYGADPVRYFLFAANTFDQDGDFSRQDFVSVANAHLANNLGNCLNRVLTLAERNMDSKVLSAVPDAELMKYCQSESERYHAYMVEFEFAKAIECAMSIVTEANKLINDKEPWKLFKAGAQAEGAAVLITALELLKRATLLLFPFTPKLSNDIWQQLGYDDEIGTLSWQDPKLSSSMPTGHQLRNKGPVFQRIEEAAVAQ